MPGAIVSQFSDFIIYADESGDHGLAVFDPGFPVFVLTFCIFRKEDYIRQIVPSLQRIKFKHFGHDMAVFHEREILQKLGPFSILTDETRNAEFMADLGTWVAESPFTMIAIVIRKPEFAARHTETSNPYHFAMKLGMERVAKYLAKHGQTDRLTHIVFEARGKKEDRELAEEFRLVCAGANYRGEGFNCEIRIVDKKVNSTGLQLADLTARPIGRHVLNPKQANRAYAVIETKLDRSASGVIYGYGLKCYP